MGAKAARKERERREQAVPYFLFRPSALSHFKFRRSPVQPASVLPSQWLNRRATKIATGSERMNRQAQCPTPSAGAEFHVRSDQEDSRPGLRLA